MGETHDEVVYAVCQRLTEQQLRQMALLPADRCISCRYWGERAEDDPPSAFRPCLGVLHDEDYATEELGWIWEDSPSEADAKHRACYDAICQHRAVLHDGSGYKAVLMTQAEFGCVLWEEKEAGDGS